MGKGLRAVFRKNTQREAWTSAFLDGDRMYFTVWGRSRSETPGKSRTQLLAIFSELKHFLLEVRGRILRLGK